MPSSTAATAFPRMVTPLRSGTHSHARTAALQVRQDAEVRWRDEDRAGAARVGGRPGQRRSDEHRPGPVEIGRRASRGTAVAGSSHGPRRKDAPAGLSRACAAREHHCRHAGQQGVGRPVPPRRAHRHLRLSNSCPIRRSPMGPGSAAIMCLRGNSGGAIRAKSRGRDAQFRAAPVSRSRLAR